MNLFTFQYLVQFFTCKFLGVGMLFVLTIAAHLAEEMQTPEERNEMKALEARNEMKALEERNEIQSGRGKVERRAVDCERPWRAVNGFPDKCYLYLYSTSTMDYETSNALCTVWHQWSRLFTPLSKQEMESVEDLIPDTVRNTTSGRYYTSFVQFGNGSQFASNSFPFEALEKNLWDENEPDPSNDEKCVLAFPEKTDNREGLCDVPCTTNPWSGNSVVCEVQRMHAREGKHQMQVRGERYEMQSAKSEVERRVVDCEEPWRAVNGFPDKCYLYLYSTSSQLGYKPSNALCTAWQPWSRLFTPMTKQEMQSVEMALFPNTGYFTNFTTWVSSRYFTSFVGNASGTAVGEKQYFSNSYPFETLNKDLWAESEPNVGGPQCVMAKQPEISGDKREGLCDVDCGTDYNGAGQSVICEVKRMSPTARRGAIMMQNHQERGQANLVQNHQERGQANMMQNGNGGEDEHQGI